MKYCDDAKQEPCLNPDDCTIPCSRDFGAVMRKVKPYPEVPPDAFVMLQEDFEDLSGRLIWASVAFLAVMVANILLALYILMRLL
jgi:hypothetical protein